MIACLSGKFPNHWKICEYKRRFPDISHCCKKHPGTFILYIFFYHSESLHIYTASIASIATQSMATTATASIICLDIQVIILFSIFIFIYILYIRKSDLFYLSDVLFIKKFKSLIKKLFSICHKNPGFIQNMFSRINYIEKIICIIEQYIMEHLIFGYIAGFI